MTEQQDQNLETRLAGTEAEIIAAQKLRFRVFYEGMGAVPDPEFTEQKRDFDRFDAYCDHLLVIDRNREMLGQDYVVGTYRLLRRSVAEKHDGFYSASEFDLSRLSNYGGEIVELGRSCVDPAYRGKAVMQLLWRGIAQYVLRHNITLMFGCASFPGTDSQTMSSALSYLYHHHRAPKAWSPVALKGRYAKLKLKKKSAIDTRQALREMPPLIKGYLRVGGVIGDGGVIDHQFNTFDVCLLVETHNVTGRYQRHYLESEQPHDLSNQVGLT